MFVALAIIISLSLMVFFHEFGHFIFGRLLGIKVEEFGFGYAPRLCGLVSVGGGKVKNRWRFFWAKEVPKGENIGTIYSLNWIPFGGFNKFRGDEAGQIKDPNGLYGRPWWQRIIVVFGGPAMNVVLAMILLIIASGLGSYQEITPDILQRNFLIKDVGIRVIAVFPSTPAEQAGLKIDDQIISLNGQKFLEIKAIQDYVKDKLDEPIDVQIKRKQEIIDFIIKPKSAKELYQDKSLEGAAIGIAMAKIGRVQYPIHLAIVSGISKTFTLMAAIVQSFYLFLKELIVHQKMIAEAVGVVGIATMTAQAAKIGIVYLMQFVAMVSLLLTLTQFIPFPALDGGHALFFLIEGIRGKPIDPKIVNKITGLGFTLLLILMIYITYKDLIRLGEQLFHKP